VSADTVSVKPCTITSAVVPPGFCEAIDVTRSQQSTSTALTTLDASAGVIPYRLIVRVP
jgi:hypothetical protein